MKLYELEEQEAGERWFQCGLCGSNYTTSRPEIDEVKYGSPLEATIPVKVLVHSCGDCGSEWTTAAAEKLRQDAVDDYLSKVRI